MTLMKPPEKRGGTLTISLDRYENAKSIMPGLLFLFPAILPIILLIIHCFIKEDAMDYRNRKFSYNCRCGYILNVFIDFGTPQENYKCRRCGNMIKREETLY